HAHGLPTQPDHRGAGLAPADDPPRLARARHRMPVQPRGDAEGVGLGDRLAQQLEQRVFDARVLDARGGEEELHAAAPSKNCQCPSDTMSTAPPTTLMAVWSSIA